MLTWTLYVYSCMQRGTLLLLSSTQPLTCQLHHCRTIMYYIIIHDCQNVLSLYINFLSQQNDNIQILLHKYYVRQWAFSWCYYCTCGVPSTSSKNLCFTFQPIKEVGFQMNDSHSSGKALLSMKSQSSCTMSYNGRCLRLVVNTMGTVWHKSFFLIRICVFRNSTFLFLLATLNVVQIWNRSS